MSVRAMLHPGLIVCRLNPPLKVPLSILTQTYDPVSSLHHERIERLRRAHNRDTSD